MNEDIKINQAGIDLVKEFEGGPYLKPYLCPAKIWTIGYGHTRTVRSGMEITAEQAEALLVEDMQSVQNFIRRLVSVKLNENEFSALCSFAYNVGVGNLESSTLLKLLNRGWYEQVPAQLMRWNRIGGEVAGGLTRRRAAEGKLWSTPIIMESQSDDTSLA